MFNYSSLIMLLTVSTAAVGVISGSADSNGGSLTLNLGNEVTEFRLGYCGREVYRTGNQIVEFSATGTGIFRGRPAIALLSRSHVADTDQYWGQVSLLLGELTPELQAESAVEVERRISEEYDAWYTSERALIQGRYLTDEIDKMKPADQIAQIKKMGQEIDALDEEANSKRYPKARSEGKVTLTNAGARYEGEPFQPVWSDGVAEFEGLSATPVTATATCSG